MEHILSRLALIACLISAPAQADIVRGSGPYLTIGGRVFTDVSSSLIELVAYASNQGATFRNVASTAASGYTPSGSKAFVVHAIEAVVPTVGAGTIRIGYADNDLGFNAACSPTNPKYLGGANSAGMAVVTSSIVGNQQAAVHRFTVPNTKYLFMCDDTAVTVHAWGYEE